MFCAKWKFFLVISCAVPDPPPPWNRETREHPPSPYIVTYLLNGPSSSSSNECMLTALSEKIVRNFKEDCAENLLDLDGKQSESKVYVVSGLRSVGISGCYKLFRIIVVLIFTGYNNVIVAKFLRDTTMWLWQSFYGIQQCDCGKALRDHGGRDPEWLDRTTLNRYD